MYATSRISVLIVLLAACGGGGGPGPSGPNAAVGLRITFPPGTCCTDAARVHVCGTTAAPGDIAVLRVNGKSAFTGDGFASWVAEVDLNQGVNELDVECVTRDGDVFRESGPRILRYGTPLAPIGIGALPDENAVVMLDGHTRAVVRVDIAGGTETVLSGDGVGSGPEPIDPAAMTLASDQSHALVFDRFRCQLIEASLPGGGRKIILGGESPGVLVGWDWGVNLNTPGTRLDVAQDAGRIAVSGDVNRLALIDRATGERDFFFYAEATAAVASVLDTARAQVLVAESLRNEVRRLTFSGQDGRFSSLAPGDGDELRFAPFPAMALDESRRVAWLVAADFRGLVGIDVVTGRRTALRTTGSELRDVSDMVLDSRRDRLLVCSAERERAWEVSLATAECRPLRNVDVGSGPEIGGLGGGVCWDGDRALVLDATRERIVQVEAGTARRADVVSAAGSIAFDVAADGRTAVVVDGRSLGVVDLASGARLTPDTAFGLVAPTSVALDERRNRALVLDALNGGTVRAVDLSTGDVSSLVAPPIQTGLLVARGAIDIDAVRDVAVYTEPGSAVVRQLDLASSESVVVAGPAVGSGATLGRPTGVACDPATGHVYVVDPVVRALVAIDPATRVRSVVSGPERGSGPALELPGSVTIDGERAIVTDETRVFAIDLGSGDRVLLSR